MAFLRGPGRRCTRYVRLALLLLALLGCRSRAFMGLPFERPAPALTAAESSELAQNVVLGSAYASTYLLKEEQMGTSLAAALPVFDQIGLVLLFAATLVAVGVYIKLNLWGEMEMKYSKQLAAWAMRIPMEQSKAEGAAEQLSAMVTGFFFALIAGLTSFTFGLLADLVVELLPILALLVPLGLALGTWTLAQWQMPSFVAPVLGRAGFFLGLYGICSLLRFMQSDSEEDAD
eukprot:s911_g9.t1